MKITLKELKQTLCESYVRLHGQTLQQSPQVSWGFGKLCRSQNEQKLGVPCLNDMDTPYNYTKTQNNDINLILRNVEKYKNIKDICTI